MLTPSPPHSRHAGLLRALCIFVFAAMALAAGYTAWISIANFARIGV